LSSNEAIKSAVFSGKGYAILPELAIKHELESGTLRMNDIGKIVFETDYYLFISRKILPRDLRKIFTTLLNLQKRFFALDAKAFLSLL
jgi:DNA-binding transcriptional LysR family regulator